MLSTLPFRRLLLGLFLCLGLTVSGVAQEPKGALRFAKVLFLGNSITKHGPKADIDWHGNWGMAATAEAKDYVHLVTNGLAKAQGAAPETLISGMAGFERGYASFDFATGLASAKAFGASHIILAIGENVPGLGTEEAMKTFKTQVQKLLAELNGPQKPVILVRSSFWANAAKDEILEQACREAGGVFVDIRALSKDESNYARSERPYKHAGVANHPGDKGMQAIADAILKALLQP